MITPTATRVTDNTCEEVNDRIKRETQMRIEYYAEHPEEVDQRLAELDAEWDVERCLELGSASLTLVGLLLGATVSKKWLLLSVGVQGFFVQHALQGWCPPLPVLRSLGVRTAEEIAEERCALHEAHGRPVYERIRVG
jgi:hypothetical protein